MRFFVRFVKLLNRIWGIIEEYFGLDDAIALLAIIIGALFYWGNGPLPYHQGWYKLYENIHGDLIGIGLGVLIIGNAEQYHRIKMEKKRLILQMGSPNNGFAIEAVWGGAEKVDTS